MIIFFLIFFFYNERTVKFKTILYLCKINIKKMGLFSLFTKEIAIDLGTANTVILYNDKVVVDEPSIIAIQRDTNEVLAVGNMHNDDGKTR